MFNQRLHLTGSFSGTHVVEVEEGVSLVTVAIRITGNPNETTLGVMVGNSDPPASTVHVFAVGSPTMSGPYRAVHTFLATEQYVAIDSGDGFTGDVMVYVAGQSTPSQLFTANEFVFQFNDTGHAVRLTSTPSGVFLTGEVDGQFPSLSMTDIGRVIIAGEDVQVVSSGFGAFGVVPVGRLTVLGDRSNGTALANLLQILEDLGWVHDSTVP